MSPSTPFLLLLLLSVLAVRAHCSTFGFDLHHRFSDKLRDWARSTSTEFTDWPEEGTPEYYSALVAHDRALLHRRGLAEGTRDLTFADGNKTLQIPAFGSLYYAEVSLGTPNVTFLVALDTGSHLTWVPCDCKNCVSTSTSSTSFNIFNSRASSTSKRVPCSSSFCTDRSSCVLPTDTCPYTVRYLDNAMSTGVLLEDVLHLITDDGRETPVQARVTFGCGQDQANTPLPTGILGLSRKSVSIPSTLAAGGLTANSFSMCFGKDRSGRIRFGDKGSPDQRTTPFNSSLALYAVTVTDVQIGGDSLAAGFDAFFDTGSTLALLKDPIYSIFTAKVSNRKLAVYHNYQKAISESAISLQFDSLMQRQRITVSSNIPIEFCYEIGPNETQISIPAISLKMKGGEELKLHGPVILVRHRNSLQRVGICLAVIKSSQVNIIGQSFMTGYKIVFDRERGVIGWNETDCYKEQLFQAPAPASAPAPVPVTVSPPHSPDASPQLQEVGPFSSGNGVPAAPLLRQPVILGSILSQLLLILSTTF